MEAIIFTELCLHRKKTGNVVVTVAHDKIQQ